MSADIKVQTEAVICAAQEQAPRTNLVKHIIDKTIPYLPCRLYGFCMKTANHVVKEFEKLA